MAAVRQGGYDGEIRLALADAPKGFALAGGAISQKRGWEDGNDTRLTITAPTDAAPGILTPRIVGTAQIDGKAGGSAIGPHGDGEAGIHLQPSRADGGVSSQYRGQAAGLRADDGRARGPCPGSCAGRRIEDPAQGRRGADGGAAIELTLDQPPWGFAARPGRIEAGKSECTLVLTADKTVKPGRLQSVVFSGTLDTGKEKRIRYAPAVLVKVAAPGRPRRPWPRRPRRRQLAPPAPAPAAKAAAQAATASLPARPIQALADRPPVAPAPVKPAAPAGPYQGTPHGGKARPIPGKIEVEDFDDGGQDVAYHVASPGKGGCVHRPQETVNLMVNGGRTVSCANSRGDWLSYTVDVAATGTYNVAVCMATAGAGKTIHLELDGADVTGSIEGTNQGWDHFVDVMRKDVKLPAGRHVMRLCVDTGQYDLDYINVTGLTTK